MKTFLLLLLLVFPSVSGADELRGMKLERIFDHAVQLTANTTWCEYRQGKCPSPGIFIRRMGRNVYGEFDPRFPNHIAINADIEIGSPEFTEIVFHEMVHYMQWMRGKLGPQSACEQIAEAEREAYLLTSQFLAKYGVKKDFLEEITLHTNLLCLM